MKISLNTESSRQVILFLSEVNEASVNLMIDTIFKLLKQKATSIFMLLSSSGGDPAFGFIAYNFLKSLSVPVQIWNIGTVSSTANILYLGGSQRFTHSMSTFLLHPFSLRIVKEQDIAHNKLREYVAQLDANLNSLIAVLKSNIPKQIDWRTAIMNSVVFSADAAVEMGYSHEILPFNTRPQDCIYRI